uniref:Uncharacterized protein n=1 Tax=Anguilla anguilla TaxID=7936 RepID=A0A0E9T9T7_ANGAN
MVIYYHRLKIIINSSNT